MENPLQIETILDELEDLEVCAKEGRLPRHVKRYRIRIDREAYVVEVTSMTGKQLLELAGKHDVARWKIFEKVKGQMVEIGLHQSVSFLRHGVEKFKTLPLDQTEG